MFHIEFWMKELTDRLIGIFGNRLEFVGLQGSYGRHEETAESDIDVVVILDQLSSKDIKTYDMIVSDMPQRQKVCGFVSGRKELENWEKSELFQFYNDTVPYYGNIDYLLKNISEEDVKRSILIGACSVYHFCVHNMLHEKDSRQLVMIYKTAMFVIQAKYYSETGQYIRRKSELYKLVKPEDADIIEEFIILRENPHMTENEFWEISEKVFEWSKKIINHCFDS